MYYANGFYIIGGTGSGLKWVTDSYFDTIYRLDKNTWKWSEVGRLNTGRIDQGVMFVHKWCRNISPNFGDQNIDIK